ncbi:hypothetical protein FQA39_LY09308 [Lamprigera yunnana]|nr:hypothetical protein FQA39_LY09308 [Lamprigera yunnana]
MIVSTTEKPLLNNTNSTISTAFTTVQSMAKILGPEENTQEVQLLYAISIPPLGTIIIVLNFVVVISSRLILKGGQQPTSTYMLLGNVALSDLVTGIAVVLAQVFPKQYSNHYTCLGQLGAVIASILASIYSVGLIAIDRYLFILHGLQYQTWVYPAKVKKFIIGTWIIGGVIGFLPLMGWYGDTKNGKICWFILMAPKELILLTVLVGIIPLAIVITLYSIILHRALKKVIELTEAHTNRERLPAIENSLRIFHGKGSNFVAPDAKQVTHVTSKKMYLPSKWKAIKVVVFTTGSFIITWFPYFVACLMYSYQCYDVHKEMCSMLRYLIAGPFSILGLVNSLINPVIYAWWHKGFRKFMKYKINLFRMKRQSIQEITPKTRSKSTIDPNLLNKTISSSNAIVIVPVSSGNLHL